MNVRLLVMLLVGFVFVKGQAQTIPMDPIDSTEALVLSSKIIAIGKVKTASTDERMAQRTFTFTVNEVLRGSPGTEISGSTRLQRFRPKLTESPSDRFLIFAEKIGGRMTAIDLDSPGVAVSTSDFRWLTTPDKVLERVRKIIKEHPRPDAVPSLDIPPPAGRVGTTWEAIAKSQGGNRLSVPVDADLEKRGFEYAKASMAPPYAFNAVAMLKPFRTDANIERLKGMLKDQDYRVRLKAEDWNGYEIRDYPSRYVASEVLKAWGVPFDPVATDTRINKIETIKSLRMIVQFDQPDLRWLAMAKNLRSLRIEFGAMSKEQLAVVSGLVGLESLSIKRVKMTDDGLKILAGLVHLRTLNLHNNQITDVGLKVLEGLPDLRSVALGGNSVTQAGIDALKKARPKLEIDTAPPKD